MNYQTLIMMLADAPRYIKKKESKKEKEAADNVLDFFQSNLQPE
nr:hypothetical protein [Prevotella intermedia]